ncbi:hypothetical protein AVEN_268373-1 [Araneus ventricosus]|uniref:Uncharacterized protein n=1 Tax=Araneus ventricosus TaxID=182803 RepID=A0A4Y2LNZ6_ARAVE|nr:hypothetical protein AVEN_268373-1 [Araneus ventricosus]
MVSSTESTWYFNSPILLSTYFFFLYKFLVFGAAYPFEGSCTGKVNFKSTESSPNCQVLNRLGVLATDLLSTIFCTNSWFFSAAYPIRGSCARESQTTSSTESSPGVKY